MADFTLSGGALLRPGTSVDVFPADNWNPHLRPPEGAPEGDPVGSGGKVGDEGTTSLSGLKPGEYYAHAEVDGEHRYVRFVVKD